MSLVSLYYPAVNIPDSDWMRKAILYTDEVSTISPYEDINDPRITDDMEYLHGERLYKPISVVNGINKDLQEVEYKKFEERFIKTVESSEFQNYAKTLTIPKDAIDSSRRDYDLYLQKVTPEIRVFLEGKKLLSNKSSSTVSVEHSCAVLYMSMLADYLARINNTDRIIPSTNDSVYETLAFQVADEKRHAYQIILDGCLPSPCESVSLKDLVKFKRKYNDELLRFRFELDDLQNKIVNTQDPQEHVWIIDQFKDRIKLEISTLQRVMGESKLDYILTGCKALLDFEPPKLLGTISTIGITVANAPLGLGLGSVILAGTLISSFRKINREVAANSFSYLYYGHRKKVF